MKFNVGSLVVLVGFSLLAACGASSQRGEGCTNCVAWQQGQSPYIKELAAQDKLLQGLSEEIRDQKKVVATAPQDTLAQRKLSDLQAKFQREEAVRLDIKTSADRQSDNFRADQATGANRKLDGKDPR
ncbi:MAG: hypothetical protein IPN71_14440 [Fibrobacteres bacterium]|nr:hypothetical protein [Fibrobacterota bacterium]